MKIAKYFFLIATLAISITLFTSCDSIPSPLNSSRHDTPSEESRDNTSSTEDSMDRAKMDSIEKARIDSVAKTETSKIVQELQERISLQSDSINDLSSNIEDLEKKAEGSLDKFSAYTFMIFEFIVLALAICMLYLKLRKLESKTRKINHAIKDISSSGNGVSDYQMTTHVTKELEKVAKQINHKNADQDRRMDDIVRRIIKLEGPMDSYILHGSEQSQPQQGNSNVFYMPRTISPMKFDDVKKKYSKDETTYFKFTVKKSGKATFVFEPYDESYIGRAYDDRENSLLTVCDIEAKSSTPKTFRNIEPGEVELQGNIWVVTKKLKLQYV